MPFIQPKGQQPKHLLPGGFSSKTQMGRMRGLAKLLGGLLLVPNHIPIKRASFPA